MDANIVWYDASKLTIEGKCWQNESRAFERFPERAEKLIPAKAWLQSSIPAGVSVRFETDAEQIFARWIDYNDEWAVNQSSICLLVLYVFDEGRWKWLGTASPIDNGSVLKLIGSPITKQLRKYMIYLPLMRGVRKLEIGIAAEAKLNSVDRSSKKPVVFYGTSIIHGGSASRPGNHLTGRLERYFNYPMVSLGLSGSALMEPSVIDLIAEIDAKVFIIDCLPNMNDELVDLNFVPAILNIRKKHPKTPIIAVESIFYQDGFLVTERRERYLKSNAALKKGFESLIKQNVSDLMYVSGDQLIFDGDETIDGTHPNDQGYYRMMNCFIPLLKPYLD